MAVKYFLVKSALKGAADKWIARLRNKDTISFDSVIKEASRIGRIYQEEHIQGAMSLIMHVIKENLKEGKSVKTPWGTFSHSIPGTFKSANDLFDYRNQNVNITFTISDDIKAVEKDIKAVKVSTHTPTPHIDKVTDLDTEQVNSVLTPDKAVEIKGSLLKLTGADASLSFKDSMGTEWVAKSIYVNTQSTIIARIPQLPEGEYEIYVRTHFNGSSKPVQKARMGKYNRKLNVIVTE